MREYFPILYDDEILETVPPVRLCRVMVDNRKEYLLLPAPVAVQMLMAHPDNGDTVIRAWIDWGCVDARAWIG